MIFGILIIHEYTCSAQVSVNDTFFSREYHVIAFACLFETLHCNIILTPQTHTRCQCKDKLFAQPITHQSSLTNPLRICLLQAKLPPGANRILFVKNLNYQITGEDLYDLFGRYGSIRQIRIGNEPKTKGTAFVVFDDVMDVRSFLFPLPQHHPHVKTEL